jgi:uncharacterized protein YciI
MSTSTTPLREYLVYVPDLLNALSKRLANRNAHNEEAIPLVKEGRVPFFGSTLAEHGAEGQQPYENGTVMVIKAESEDEIKAMIKKDVFTTEGVWDVARLTIWPFTSQL